ncbi:Alpha/Beta hydrolase protein [Calycina marina]|uniref:Alpha/Beta hydrolase protein n=1 Tax=Calycina marina TaxID=1763456 RepID=A0A9P7YXL3_9HELO|nr:Alpha/Beta hydrolase protein [Calycina marina]
MILEQVSWLDCLVFLLFLAPQLIYRVGFFQTVSCALQALPFLLVKLPICFIQERYRTPFQNRSPFVQRSEWFEDLAVGCVRYAFRQIPAHISRVFFSRYVALPFMRFRMLRLGYFKSPVHWQEIKMNTFQGLWISDGVNPDPDIILYYIHGGGFSLGSCHFYLEFLITMLDQLKATGYRAPAIFALEYTLVPDESYPVQIHQVISAYKNLCVNHDPSRIVLSGDSAGGTLALNLLLHIAKEQLNDSSRSNRWRMEVPAMAVLISPWVTLVSSKDKNNASDYLDAEHLHHYARQYAGNKISVHGPLISPGDCRDLDLWRKASPTKGFFFCYGAEELFAPEIRDLVEHLELAEIEIDARVETGGIHVWPITAWFLRSTKEDRLRGIKIMATGIREPPG